MADETVWVYAGDENQPSPEVHDMKDVIAEKQREFDRMNSKDANVIGGQEQ